jgi:hypothetical protein
VAEIVLSKHEEGISMKSLRNTLSGIIAAGLLSVATGCVTNTTIGGAADYHGLFSGYPAADHVTKNATELGSYSVILNLFDAGHAEYAEKIKAAEAQGKKVTTKTTWYVFFTTTTAYAK